MKIKNIFLPALAGLAIIAAPHTVHGGSDIMAELEDLTKKATIELAVQVNLSGKQRMLTQKMSKEALLVALGIDANDNRNNLKKTIALFDKTLIGLQKGDHSLGLVETINKDILDQLQRVAALWQDFKPLVVSQANSDKKNKTTLEQIAIKNMPLLAAMNVAVGMYANISGADTAELAVVINLSGKQRMLTQKMTKEFLMIAHAIKVKENQQALVNSISLFDKTLKGLLDGSKELGLPSTTDTKIRDQLVLVKKHWLAFSPLLQKPASDISLRQVAKANLPLLSEMNKAVKMYELSW